MESSSSRRKYWWEQCCRYDHKWFIESGLRKQSEQSAETRLVRCLNSAATTERLARDAALADRWRVTGTPTFVSEHARIVGAASEGDLEKLLDR